MLSVTLQLVEELVPVLHWPGRGINQWLMERSKDTLKTQFQNKSCGTLGTLVQLSGREWSNIQPYPPTALFYSWVLLQLAMWSNRQTFILNLSTFLYYILESNNEKIFTHHIYFTIANKELIVYYLRKNTSQHVASMLYNECFCFFVFLLYFRCSAVMVAHFNFNWHILC